MGGGQANSGQASQAAAQQTAANAQDMALSAQYGGQEKQIFSSLFGNGSPGSTGTLSGMMNPANLTQTGLNPAYQAQFNQGVGQIGQSTAQQKGSLAQSFANSGASGNSTPSGFQADQMRQLGSSQANQQGQLYSGLMGSQYQNALSNFWNANNIASGQTASTTSGSTTGAGNSGTSSAQIYGTAGQPTPGALNSTIGATGAVGGGLASNAALMCPADDAKILMADGSWKKVQELAIGDKVMGADRRGDELIDIQPTLQTVCTIFTSTKNVTVSLSHTFERHRGGYSFAAKSLAEFLELDGGPEVVIEVRPVQVQVPCRHLMLKRSHGYCCDGFWSLE